MSLSRSAGLLAFLLALPSLALVAPPASEATATGAVSEGGEGVDAAAVSPGLAPVGSASALEGAEAMEARLRRLSEAIRARAGQLEESQRGTPGGEPWLAAGGWLNGNNRGWLNRGWNNGGFNRTPNFYRTPSLWANFRPSWRNFTNGPRFINW
jgi:hypothetical protein